MNINKCVQMSKKSKDYKILKKNEIKINYYILLI